jgi:hypothetical protein
MQLDQFHNALSLDAQQLPELHDELVAMIDKYPWFSTAHVLVAKSEQLTRKESYEERLKVAALHVADREVLFDLLMRDRFKASVEAIEREIEATDDSDENDEVAVADEVSDVSDAVKTADGDSALETEAETETEIETETESEPRAEADTEIENEEEGHQDSHEDGKEVKDAPLQRKRVKAEDLDDLQREMVLEAIKSTIEIESREEADEAKAEEHEEEQSESTSTADAETPVAEEPVTSPRLTDTTKLSPFTAWLLQKAEDTHWHEAERQSRKVEQTDASAAFAANEEENETSEATPKDQQSLIDAFIQKDPKITPGAVDKYTTDDLAKMSLVDDEEWVTETMAELYARQGKVRKAVKAYKLLSLKYPEKSIYFANRIKKLRASGKSN